MEKQKSLLITLRAKQEDSEAISAVEQKLNLNRSEVSRRALRVGLEVLNNAIVPGARALIDQHTA